MRLYKYRRFDKRQRWADIIRNNRVYFARPEDLNDPLDCRPRVVAAATPEEIDAYVRRVAEDLASHLDGEDRERLVQEARARHESPAQLQRIYYSLVASRYGILSLSAVADHPLLWVHYADNHRGLCIEFDAPEGAESLFGGVYPVRYQRERPLLDVLKTRDPSADGFDLLRDGLLTKSKHWEYEKEYRVPRGEGEGLVAFPPEALTAVILGGRVTRENRQAVIELLQTRHQPVRLLQVAFEEESFALRLERLA